MVLKTIRADCGRCRYRNLCSGCDVHGRGASCCLECLAKGHTCAVLDTR